MLPLEISTTVRPPAFPDQDRGISRLPKIATLETEQLAVHSIASFPDQQSSMYAGNLEPLPSKNRASTVPLEVPTSAATSKQPRAVSVDDESRYPSVASGPPQRQQLPGPVQEDDR